MQQVEREGARAAIAAQFHRHGHILERGQGRDELEILKDKTDMLIPDPGALVLADFGERDAVEQHRTGSGKIQSRRQTEQRGFAAARRAEDRTGRALLQGERDVAAERSGGPRRSRSFSLGRGP